MPFSDFIRLCKQHMMMISKENNTVGVDAKSSASLTPLPQDPTPGQIYLAQVSCASGGLYEYVFPFD